MSNEPHDLIVVALMLLLVVLTVIAVFPLANIEHSLKLLAGG